MRDLGIHTIPTLAALPGSGVAGQQVNVSNQVYYWDTSANVWQPICEDLDQVLAANYTNTTTTLSNVFSGTVVSGGIYEVRWTLMWQTAATSYQMKQAFTSPSGSTQAIISTVSGTANGVTTPTFLELGVSGTSQNAPASGTASTYLTNTGHGMVSAGSTGGVALQAGLSATGTLTIAKGSVFHLRRVA